MIQTQKEVLHTILTKFTTPKKQLGQLKCVQI